ncbi:MAG: NAD-dependent epimerase/dehydratase family protein [Proteobacteria bacterium]|nr:NAD-dependent epimerase/dehydratase family protein [Pseudomonadota bacterium]MBU4356217.1 NAD-dependent epimerase/dehydratase family protein [Pseudomonadota bacterium]MBU4449436.1 NAD-dependent epimerase/dehydratase family protein [Pseudomonadota bacterium]MCG2773838.1 NAD-dependent epimerase/dehydratase family protein [Desulfobacterales bacterium]
MQALVTGAAGFIGSHLVEALLQRGVRVRCLVRPTSHLKWVEGLPVEIIYGDCREKDSLGPGVKDVDLVFHLAGATRAIDAKTYFEVNALGTDNLVQACLEHNTRLQKFIYLSSQAAAGPGRNGGKKKESDHCSPVSPYGMSKRRGEELALSQAHELPLLILRPAAVYGPRDKAFLFLFQCLVKRIKPSISGGVEHLSLCSVQDLVGAILLAASTRTQSGEIFFLSDGHDYRMEEINDVLAQAMEVTAFRLRLPAPVLFGIAAVGQYFSKISGKPVLISRGRAEELIQPNWLCDITKARTLLGFEPQISLARGAKLTFDWYRKENWL